MPPRKLMRDVIVCLPGITGSVLQKDGKDVWNISGRHRDQRAEDARPQHQGPRSSRTTRPTSTTSATGSRRPP